MKERQEIKIRPRTATDLPQLGRILREVHRLDGYPVEGVTDPADWLETPGLLGSWVATINGAIIGQVSLNKPAPGDAVAEIATESLSLPIENLAILGRLFIGPNGRGYSLGRKLSMTATAFANTKGRRAILEVMLKDRAAIRTYEGLSWVKLRDLTHVFGSVGQEPAAVYAAPPPH